MAYCSWANKVAWVTLNRALPWSPCALSVFSAKNERAALVVRLQMWGEKFNVLVKETPRTLMDSTLAIYLWGGGLLRCFLFGKRIIISSDLEVFSLRLLASAQYETFASDLLYLICLYFGGVMIKQLLTTQANGPQMSFHSTLMAKAIAYLRRYFSQFIVSRRRFCPSPHAANIILT